MRCFLACLDGACDGADDAPSHRRYNFLRWFAIIPPNVWNSANIFEITRTQAEIQAEDDTAAAVADARLRATLVLPKKCGHP